MTFMCVCGLFYCGWFLNSNSVFLFCFYRGPRVRQLRSDFDSPVAAGRHRSLPVQRLWTLLQDERAEPAAHQAQAQTGKCKSSSTTFLLVFFLSLSCVCVCVSLSIPVCVAPCPDPDTLMNLRLFSIQRARARRLKDSEKCKCPSDRFDPISASVVYMAASRDLNPIKSLRFCRNSRQ